MTATLEEIQVDAAADYRSLVLQLAAGGDEPTKEQIREVMAAATKSLADLTRDVARARERYEAQQQLRDAGANWRRIRDLEAERASTVQLLQRLRAEFDENCGLHNRRLSEIDEQTRQLEHSARATERAANRCLCDGADPRVHVQINALRGKVAETGQAEAEVRSRIDGLRDAKGRRQRRSELESDLRGTEEQLRIAPAMQTVRREELEATARWIRARLDVLTQLEGELADLASQRQLVTSQISELEKRLYEPDCIAI